MANEKMRDWAAAYMKGYMAPPCPPVEAPNLMIAARRILFWVLTAALRQGGALPAHGGPPVSLPATQHEAVEESHECAGLPPPRKVPRGVGDTVGG